MAFSTPRQDYIVCSGGLDQLSPPASTPPGTLMAVSNFRVLPTGGYRRIDGYERFDGSTAPSSVGYTVITVDRTLEGTADVAFVPEYPALTVLGQHGDELYVYGEHTLQPGASLLYAAASYTITSCFHNNALLPAVHAEMRAAAADVRRAEIGPVPGTGPIYGVVPVEGAVLAFRDNAVFVSSPSGWQAVSPAVQLDVEDLVGQVAPGDMVAGSSGSAVVDKVILVYGDGSSTSPAKGTILLRNVSGTFTAGEPLDFPNATAVAGGPASSFVPQPGGAVDSTLFNFLGRGARTAYAVDGVTDRIYVYDGSLYSVPMFVGVGLTYVEAHSHRLVVAAAASIMISSASDPLVFDAVVGGAEVACGSDVTALVSFRGDTSSAALLVGTERDVRVLYGTDASNWRLDTAVSGLGVLPGCAAFLGNDVLFASVSGIYSLHSVTAFGNFSVGQISQRVATLFERVIKPKLMRAIPVPENSECRFIGDDGVVLSVVFVPTDGGGQYQFSVYDYITESRPEIPISAVAADIVDGESRVFFADDRFVYRADSGTSFDGEAMVAFFATNFVHNGAYLVRKRYKRIVVEAVSDGHSDVAVSYDLSPMGFDSLPSTARAVLFHEGSKFFDVTTWDRFVWSSYNDVSAVIDSPGTGPGISLMLKHSSSSNDPFTVKSFTVTYTLGRMERK